MKDFYNILGLDVNCTADEIREAYRKLSKKFHPDLNQHDNYFENRFKDVRQAYETLIDPRGRTAYDSLLKKSKTQITKQKDTKKLNLANTTKSIDIAFTIMLIVFTFLFGNYVIKSITGSKHVKVAKAAVIEEENIPSVKHHKKKKHIFRQDHAVVVVPSVLTEQKTTVKPEIKPSAVIQPTIAPEVRPTIQTQPKPAVIAQTPVSKATPLPISAVKESKATNIIIDDNILTSAYIKANSTGVVYLRSADSYNSDVVSRIPDNARIAILEKGDSFYKISYGNKTGYVPKWTVKND